MGKFYGVKELARLWGVATPGISQVLFHEFSEQEVPLISGRRIIPEALVPRVADRLRARGIDVNPSAAIPT